MEPSNANPSVWPGQARCAVALCFDVDGETGILGMDPGAAERLSALSQGRYGPTVGVPRLLDLLAEKELRATFFVPGGTALRHPEMVKQIASAGHEIGNHGHRHLKADTLSLAEEREEIRLGNATLNALIGHDPVGFRAPWWELHQRSPALLAEMGFVYDSSLMSDDRPFWLETDNGPLLEIPVQWLLDDWEQFGYSANVPEFGAVIESPEKAFEVWRAEFEGLYYYGGCFVLTMHPFISGRPSRVLLLKRLIEHIQTFEGVWWATCADIARHWQEHHPFQTGRT